MKYFAFILLAATIIYSRPATAQNKTTTDNREFTQSLMQDSCTYTTTGKNRYFILIPGYKLLLKGKEGNDSASLLITVLNETKTIGNIETRVVEESESVNGKPTEISRNYYAFCTQTGSIYCFGEDVDAYKNGQVINHSGSWKAENNNKQGLAMPGLVLSGSRFYQEIAPGIAMDRSEIISNEETFVTPAGKFTHVLKIKDTSPLEPNDKEYKLYAPNIGLIKDENLVLVKNGFF